MNKNIDNINQSTTFHGKTGTIEKVSFGCNTFILLIFLFDQLHGNMNMWFLILLFSIIEIYLIIFDLWPEDYIFQSNALTIHHRFKRDVIIQYDSIFNLDEEKKDSFINITMSGNVKLYYSINGSKKSVLCRPKEASLFVDTIKTLCPEFHEELNGKTDIEKII